MKSADLAKKQHNLAVSLLKKLGLDYIRLEPQPDGRYRYVAWSTPRPENNGQGRIPRQGVIAR